MPAAAHRVLIRRGGPVRAVKAAPQLGAAGKWLAALLGAVIALLAVLFAGATDQDQAASLEAGWESAANAAHGAAEHAARSLASARLITDAIAEKVRRGGPAALRGPGFGSFAAALRNAPQIGSLWVLDADGVLAANSLEPEPPRTDLSDRPYVAALRSGEDTHIARLLLGRVNGVWFFSFSRAVRGEDGALLGIVQASMHSEEFQRFQLGLGLGPRGRIGLFRASDGAPLMLCPLPVEPGQGGMPPPAAGALLPEVLRAVAAGQREGRFEQPLGDGRTLLAAWQLSGADDSVIATAALPRDQALAAFHDRLLRNLALFGFAVMLVIALGWAVAVALARAGALRRRAETGQRELAAVLEATGEGVIVLDPQWRVGFLNTRAAEALAGGTDVSGQPVWQALPDLADGAIRRACERTMASRAPAEAEQDIPRLGRHFRADAHPREDGGIVVFYRDVTEEHAAAARLAESEARLRRVLDNLFAFVWVLSPDGTLLEANRAPLAAAGLRLGAVRGRAFWDCEWWSGDREVQERLRAACVDAAAGRPSRYDVALRMPDDSRMIVDFQIEPLTDAADRITHLIASATDITARSQAEAALAESEGRSRMAQQAAEVGVFERVLPSEKMHWSPAMFRLYGLDPATRGPWVSVAEHLALLHPDEQETHDARRIAMRADPSRNRFSFEFRICRADNGEVRWLASRGEVVRDEAGRPALIRGINYDVTEQRRAEERQFLLAREVDHRAKNALAVVQAIVGLTRDADPASFRAAVTGRIAAMARAHNLLAREGWYSAELRELIEEEIAPHHGTVPDGPARVALQGPSVALAAGAAQPVAMALHELATNAVKYGALSRPAGGVTIAWERTADDGLLLRWTERGGPELTRPPARRGFGSSVIRNTVERQLGGEALFDWAREGLECRLSLPASQLRWPQPAQRAGSAG